MDYITNIRNDIKEHIITNGGLFASLYWSDGRGGANEDFLSENYACYDDGTISRNIKDYHAVTIIGWDDKYDRMNFSSKNSDGEIVRPNENGAYIALNSWGEDWGNNGYFYISYEDAEVEKSLAGYLSVDKTPRTVKYNLKNQKSYNVLKKAFAGLEDGINANDDTFTIEVPDILLETVQDFNFSECNLTDEDLEEIFKKEFPNLHILNLNSNKITNITPLVKNKKLKDLSIKDNSNNRY